MVGDAARKSILGMLRLDEDIFSTSAALSRMRGLAARAPGAFELPASDIAGVRDLEIPGATPCAARLYTPIGAGEAAPAILFLHGGGFMLGGPDSHDRVCRRLAARAEARVLALDYRLAPEHPFPAAVDDAATAFDWMAGEGATTIGVDPARLGVAGDSAGGGLAAVLAQARRGRLRHQLLIYPLLQLAKTSKPRPKVLEGHVLSGKVLDRIAEAYLGGADLARDPRVSPLLTDDLHGLAPAYILAAELDPLLDEGAAYADRLAAFGVPSTRMVAKGLPHGFCNMTRLLPGSANLLDAAALAAGEALRR